MSVKDIMTGKNNAFANVIVVVHLVLLTISDTYCLYHSTETKRAQYSVRDIVSFGYI